MYGKMQREGILFWTITRRQVSRDLWLLRPSPVIAHWVSYQQKPSSELGTSFPSNARQKGHEMPPKVCSDLWPQGGRLNYKLALTKSIVKDWTRKCFAICLCGDWTPCCKSSWWHQTLMTNKKPFCKLSASWYWTSPSPKPYILTFPHCRFGAVSQSYLRWCLPGFSPHFA